MNQPFDLSSYGIDVANVLRNPSTALLYEQALRNEKGSALSSTGALIAMSGAKTGRSPQDKRVVRHPDSQDDIWWGSVNIPLDERSFVINHARAVDYLNTRDHLYVIDGYAGWDPTYRLKVRVVCARAYHALFMKNMLIRLSDEELAEFGEPDFVIFNSGQFPANRHTAGMTSKASIDISFEKKQMVILGTEYAGEMKKGVFTVMHYLMPLKDVLSMHCSANEGKGGDVSIFFGLSGTGKTTLSADANRYLVGDDEHCWSADGIFNIEGGCYAKCIDLSADKEPEIYNAIRYGSVLENVVYDRFTHAVDYSDVSITQNTRTSYPIEFIDNAKLPCIAGHPSNIILLTCDAFGVLPPVSRLTPEQAMYHFISGYTAKVAGTEVGITEPEATFSACFGAAFLVLHPARYAEMLAERIRQHGSKVWLVNTGWTGGPYGVGHRIDIPITRAIIDAIHSNTLAEISTVEDPIFGLHIPTECPSVPASMLDPRSTWGEKSAYDKSAHHLATLFKTNFAKYEAGSSDAIKNAGPRV